jgi:peptide/nickel transport system permease protein
MKQFWKQMLRNPSGLIGLIILVIAVFLAVAGPVVFPNSPWRMVQRPFLPPFTLSSAPLGTDALGRDVFAGMIYGARVSLLVGLVSTLAALAIGVPLGAIAGYFGGRIDDALMRFTEFFHPSELCTCHRAGGVLQPSIYSIVASIAIVSWPQSRGWCAARCCPAHPRICQAAIVTGQTTAGSSGTNPAQRAVACDRAGVADGCDRDPAGIAATLLGLGDPNPISWGYMVGAGRTVIRQAWWITVFPASRSCCPCSDSI